MEQGKISPADIQRIAKDLGENFTDRDIQEMIEEADRDSKFDILFPYLFEFGYMHVRDNLNN